MLVIEREAKFASRNIQIEKTADGIVAGPWALTDCRTRQFRATFFSMDEHDQIEIRFNSIRSDESTAIRSSATVTATLRGEEVREPNRADRSRV